MSNKGSLSVNYIIDNEEIKFKDVEIFSDKSINLGHPFSIGTKRPSTIRLGQTNLDNMDDKELNLAETFLSGKQLLSDDMPAAEAESVSDEVPLADSEVVDENKGTIATQPDWSSYPGNTNYPEGEAGVEVTDEDRPGLAVQPGQNGILNTISDAASATGNAATNAVTATGNALGSAANTIASGVSSTLGSTSKVAPEPQPYDGMDSLPPAHGGPGISLAPLGKQARATNGSDNPAFSPADYYNRPHARLGGKRSRKGFNSKYGGKRTKKSGKQRRTRRNRNNKRKTSKIEV